jgi:hypothetical protein
MVLREAATVDYPDPKTFVPAAGWWLCYSSAGRDKIHRKRVVGFAVLDGGDVEAMISSRRRPGALALARVFVERTGATEAHLWHDGDSHCSCGRRDFRWEFGRWCDSCGAEIDKEVWS